MQRRERITPADARRHARVAHRARGRVQHEPRDQREADQRADEAARDDQPELQVAGRDDQQPREQYDADRIRGPRDARRVAPVAPQHPHRRHARERRERRQREAEQQHERRADADQRGLQRRRRERHLDQAAERAEQRPVAAVAEHRARHARHDAEPREFEREQRAERTPAHAEAAHRRAAVEMTPHVALRGHRDRDRGQQRGEQRDQRQEMASAIERLPHLRLPFLQRFEPDAAQLAAVDAPVRIRFEARDGTRVAGDQQPVHHTAAVAREARRGELVRAHHQPRREIDEREATIELARNRRGDRERAQPDAHGVAGLQMQRVEQRRIGPHGAGRGDVGRLARGGRAGRHDLDGTAQRIACRHRLHGREARGRRVARPGRGGRRDHAREDGRRRGAQAERVCVARERRIDRMIGAHHEIGAEHLSRVALEPLAQPVCEKTDARQRGDREHQRQHEQREFARAPVARGHPRGLVHQVAPAEAAGMRGPPGRRRVSVLTFERGARLQSRLPPIELSRDTMW